MKRRLALVGIGVAIACAGGGDGAPDTASSRSGSGATLAAVRARGSVRCGISQQSGFATPDDSGRWRGFDVDFCRAMAVAIFDDPERVQFVPFTQQQRFSGLQSGEADLLVNGTSLTMGRATKLGFHFGPVYLYDGQSFLVPRSLGIDSAKQLDGASVCVQQGTTTELNLTDFARRNGIRFRPVVIEEYRGVVSALQGGRCDVITQDGAGLATTRSMMENPADYSLLPDRISKEPIAPVVRYGDDQWLELVTWVFHAPVQAEELGLTRGNVAERANGPDPALRRFLGAEPGVTDVFGLDARWTYNIVAKIGNYGEIYDRHLGPDTPLGMERGLNRLWIDGGLMYAPPFR